MKRPIKIKKTEFGRATQWKKLGDFKGDVKRTGLPMVWTQAGGYVVLHPGDWIVEIGGEVLVVQDRFFHGLYEKV